jgi:hypothetical protein
MSDTKKTTLIYFGSPKNSKFGTLRGGLAFVLLCVSFLFLKYINNELFVMLMGRKTMLFVSLIAIVSALTVVVPTDTFDAAKYGASVAIVLSICIATAWSADIKKGGIAFIITSTILGALISTIVYVVSKKLEWYPFPSS